ncbi:hypothetical protein EVAR_44499_1 [Eumeta japonica]|uniref:ATP-dependent DNA helicase n=1 Tax=Eumeta variegata TaxID=151549 RepID=A0A4C1WKH1_EUMVA|nr:hypothetical protein EVAR_44499_1 [Eumeta japonica]
MEGGRTAHSALQLPLNIAEQQFPVCKISGTSGRGQLLKHAKIIFWDECTMAHKKSLEAMDRTLQELRKNGRSSTHTLRRFSTNTSSYSQFNTSRRDQCVLKKVTSLAKSTNTAINKKHEG